MTPRNQRGSNNAAFPRLVVYSGAGVAVPNDFLCSTYSSPFERFGVNNFTTISSASAAADTITIPANNGRLDRSETVVFSATTGALPSPLQIGVVYYPVNKTAGVTFQVALTPGGAPINLTSSGSGTTNVRLGDTDLGSAITVGRSLDSSCPTWAHVNTSSGVYSWADFDEYMDYHFKQRGRRLLLCLNQTPTWAASNTALDAYSYAGGGQVPTSLTAAADFVTAALNRYNAVSAFNPTGAKMIYGVEAWNEPSFAAPGTVGQNWCGTMAQLAEQTRHVYNAVKAVDSSCLVLGPGFTQGLSFSTFGDSPSLPAWLNASDGASGVARQWIDGVAYHAYGVGANTDQMTLMPERLSLLRRNIVQAGMSASTPIYMTERGVDDVNDPLAHARAALVEAALGVKLSCVYAHDFYGAHPAISPSLRSALNLIQSDVCGATITYCAIMQSGRVRVVADGQTIEI